MGQLVVGASHSWSSLLFPSLIIAGLFLYSPVEGRVCGTRLVEEYRSRNPSPIAKPLVDQQGGDEIKVGTQLQFVVFNRNFLMPATCRYVGADSYIFVEDIMWDTNGGPLVQQDVDGLGALFDESTPVDPERGLFEIEEGAFGEASDEDGDPRVFIVVLNMGPLSGGRRLLGFFDNSVSTHPDPSLRRDAVYLDATEVWLRKFEAGGTLAHELQHLIHWGHDPDEELWINEGLSGYAEELTGFPEIDPSVVPAFLVNPDIDITSWGTPAQAYNYGSTYLFASFLAERFGEALVRGIVAEPENGIDGVEGALQAQGIDQDFIGVWSEWIAANFEVQGVGSAYAALQDRKLLTFTLSNLPFVELLGVGSQWGALNLLIRRSGDIRVDFEADIGGSYWVWLFSMRDGSIERQQLMLNGEGAGSLTATDVDSLGMVIGRTSSSGGIFSLSARQEQVLTAVLDEPQAGVTGTYLDPSFPNPFNGQTVVGYALAQSGPVEVSLYNLIGQRVRILQSGFQETGTHQLGWNGKDQAGADLASGTYLVVLKTDHDRLMRRLILLR